MLTSFWLDYVGEHTRALSKKRQKSEMVGVKKYDRNRQNLFEVQSGFDILSTSQRLSV
jgi:hypothetical protein